MGGLGDIEIAHAAAAYEQQDGSQRNDTGQQQRANDAYPPLDGGQGQKLRRESGTEKRHSISRNKQRVEQYTQPFGQYGKQLFHCITERRKRATGIPSCSRYLATVRRAIL